MRRTHRTSPPKGARPARRRLAAVFCLALGLDVAGCAPECEPHPGPERIILIVADTLRPDRTGVYGAKAPTPHMKALAAEGQVFPDVSSSFHLTVTSMGSMFTGQVPSLEVGRDDRSLPWTADTWCGLARFRETEADLCVPLHLETLAEGMAEAGYWTVGATANPLLFDPMGYSQGFDEWLEIGIAPDAASRSKSERHHAESRSGLELHAKLMPLLRDRPSDRFFLYLQYLDVHDYHLLGKAYAKGVRLFDERLGDLIAFLEVEGLLEGSVIVLTSDHGERLGESHPVRGRGGHLGNPSYEQVLRVPLIVRPAVFDRTDVTIRGDDLRGMLLAIAAGEPALPAGDAPRELFVSEALYQTYRLGRFKSMWPREGGTPVLFDLELDPKETRDIGAEHPDLLDAHRRRLDELAAGLAPGADAPAPKEIDADAIERLRVLGYLETLEDE